MTDLARDAMMLAAIVNDIDETVSAEDLGTDLNQALVAWQVIEDANRQLAVARTALTNLLAEDMPTKQLVVEGVGVFEKHGKKNRTKWDKDSLLRVVLDSRVVDAETGEIREESQLDRVLDVWNLGAPRTTALKARGIDPDEFSESEWAGYSIQVVAP